MSNKINDIVFDNLTDWLSDHGATAKDVMFDDEGYYILTDTDNGNPGEDGYNTGLVKIYLPEIFNPLL